MTVETSTDTENLLELVDYHAGGSGFVAGRAMPIGAVVALLSGVQVARPTTFTIQVGRSRHIDAYEVRYLNHSCAPSTFVDTAAGRIVALRPVRAGEELTFFYPSTEWRMASPFDCRCGHDACLGRITGAEALPARVLARYALNDHISKLAAERNGIAAHSSAAG